MNYHPDLEALKNRFVVFTNKLMDKANELENDAKLAAQDVYNEDSDRYKRAYGQFKLGIEGQFKGLITKSAEIFDQQILPLRMDSKYKDSSLWCSDLRTILLAFEDTIRKKAINVFDDLELISNEFYLQQILDEYEAIKDAFNCQQCGANLSVDQMYFVSTYITCTFCQTQNTFIPGTRMTELEGLSRDLAEERLKTLKEEYSNFEYSVDSNQNKTLNYLFYRAYVWVEKSRIVPIYTNNYLKVFLRELHDQVSGFPSDKLKLKSEMYYAILIHLGFVKQMKPKVLDEYQSENFDRVKILLADWEMLFLLSSVTLTYLFQGVEHQEFHDEHFQRIQNQWILISSINKALAANEMDLQEAIDTINIKIN